MRNPTMRSDAFMNHAIDAHGDAVLRLALNQLRNVSDAQDAVQETFVRLLTSGTSFESDDHLRAWLLRVAINACKDVLKSARRRNESVEELADAGREGELGAGSDQATLGLHAILDAMDALGDPPKTQLYLALYEGYTAREISQMTGMPEGTVYSWISRGKKQLREALQ